MCWPPSRCTSSHRTLLQCVLCCMMCLFAQTADGQEPASGIQSSSDHGPEIYGAIYVLGSLAKNRNLNVGGAELPSTTVRDGAGGGFRAGVFPAFTGYIVGIQAESFGLGHEVSAPASMGSSGVQSGRGTLLAWTTMVSLLVQYPGTLMRPYVGAGVGWSSSFLLDTQLMKGSVTQTGTLRDTSAAFQYFTGLRAHVTESVFVFGEYKYFASRYQWGGSLDPSLDFRTQIVVIGIGLSFK
jgi:opacity protein-like surface antigen